MTAGCLLFIPASSTATFGLFLAALFVLASGITIVQVVANPLISLLGQPRTAQEEQCEAPFVAQRGLQAAARHLAARSVGEPVGVAFHAQRLPEFL